MRLKGGGRGHPKNSPCRRRPGNQPSRWAIPRALPRCEASEFHLLGEQHCLPYRSRSRERYREGAAPYDSGRCAGTRRRYRSPCCCRAPRSYHAGYVVERQLPVATSAPKPEMRAPADVEGVLARASGRRPGCPSAAETWRCPARRWSRSPANRARIGRRAARSGSVRYARRSSKCGPVPTAVSGSENARIVDAPVSRVFCRELVCGRHLQPRAETV